MCLEEPSTPMLEIDADSLAQHTKPYKQQAATTRQHIVAVYPSLILVYLLTMSSNLNCAGPSEDDVVEIQTAERGSITFNNMLSSSWQAVRDNFVHLQPLVVRGFR
jgi:hypothetical protein